MTRGMMVTTLYRLAGEPQVEGTATFQDVKSSAYYANAVAWAEANGIARALTPVSLPQRPRNPGAGCSLCLSVRNGILGQNAGARRFPRRLPGRRAGLRLCRRVPVLGPCRRADGGLW